jgi:hypothetical protein
MAIERQRVCRRDQIVMKAKRQNRAMTPKASAETWVIRQTLPLPWLLI